MSLHVKLLQTMVFSHYCLCTTLLAGSEAVLPDVMLKVYILSKPQYA